MGRFLLVIAAVALHVYVLVDLARAPRGDVRMLPKGLWFVVSLIPVVGPLGWLLIGRPRVGPAPGGRGGGGGIAGGPRPRGPIAPDDDPDFLKRLDEQTWAAKMERLRRERESGGGPEAGSGPGESSTPDPTPDAP